MLVITEKHIVLKTELLTAAWLTANTMFFTVYLRIELNLRTSNFRLVQA